MDYEVPESNYAEERGDAEPFIIDNDNKADWAIRKIAEARAEHDRIVGLASEQSKALQAKIDAENERLQKATERLTGQLASYMLTVPCKSTKTQSTYRLLSGTLKRKNGGTDFRRDAAVLLEWLKKSGKTGFIKSKEEPSWEDLKETLTFTDDGDAITAEGEIVPGVKAEKKSDKFEVITE
jgi:phage host-nuclease inhibitor protein Gam